MRLLIVRHAIAVPHGTPEVPEEARPLTPRGDRRFREAARGLARICGRPDVLLSSPLVRARQTADIAAEAWGKVKVREEAALAGGSFEKIAAALDKHADKKLVAIFGHEPDVSSVVARLLGTSASERLTFKKGGAALVDVPGPMADGGALIWYLPPRVLRSLK
jgi:phosphohistidine phosphatase